MLSQETELLRGGVVNADWRALLRNKEKLQEVSRALVFVLKNKIMRSWTTVSSGPTAAPLPDMPEPEPNKIPGTLRCGRNTNTQSSRSFYAA